MTSADTALRILRGQNIWSTDADQMANFSLNQNPVESRGRFLLGLISMALLI